MLCAILVKEGGIVTPYYVYTDHLSSLLTITNSAGTVIAEQNFDAWGRKRNPANWQYAGVPTTPAWLYRGYTSHEHLPQFTLINMNGRMYDPIQGRMLSPDNYVQEPFNTQNFNRYGYCLNNPLKYTDPSGDLFLFTIVTAAFDFLRTGFTKGGFEFWNWGSQNFRSAWRDFDPTSSGSRTNNAFKIDVGKFKTDPNKTFFGRIFQGISRFTWELPQTVIGHTSASVVNLFGGVRSVSYYGGATAVETNKANWGVVTQASFIIGERGLRADPNNPLFQHEYGPYIQSQLYGPLYYGKVGIPSLFSHPPHNFHPVEQDANTRAFAYFNKNIPGYSGWDNNVNRIVDPNFRLSFHWFDILDPLDIINSIYLNRQY